MDKIKTYKQYIKKNPDNAVAYQGLGCAYGESGKYKEAIESYKQAIRIDPDHADAQNVNRNSQEGGLQGERV